MKHFDKACRLDNVFYDVRGPVVEEAARMSARGIDVLKLNIGNPAPFGFRAPERLLECLSGSLCDSEGYSDSKGLLKGREAIARYCAKKGIQNVSAEDVYTGNGVSELIQMTMQALLNPGDEVLIPSPDYPLWTAAVTMVGGRPVHYICDEESDWLPDTADMSAKVTSKTKAIVVINPNNPTGALYPKSVLEEIAEVARKHGLLLFSDEIYDRLVYDGQEHISTASVAPDLFTVTFNGLSKSHNIAGFRCGWISLGGEKSHVRGYIEGINMLSSMRLCSNVPAQQIIPRALEDGDRSSADFLPGGRLHKQREFIVKAINDISGLSVKRPKAAFYIFPKLDAKRFNILDDERFAYDFLHQKQVLIVQGSGFNWHSPDHFRLVYLPKLEDLKAASGRLAEFLEGYRQGSLPTASNM